jgi:hypothetical protein
MRTISFVVMKKIVPISIVAVVGGFFLYPYLSTDDFLSQEIVIEDSGEKVVFAGKKDLPPEDFGALLYVQSDNFFFDESGNVNYHTATHVDTPESVRGVYMTSWIAGRKDLRKNIHQQIKDNESINTVIIDIKDDTGKISFPINHPLIQELDSSEGRIQDMREFIADLHADDIYVIGRIAVFQDPYLITKWPEEAVKKVSNPEENWVDRKNIGWMDASSERVWDYVNTIAEESYKVGFDEINFDYIRFPSDGNMKDVLYTMSQGKQKPEVLESFFKYTSERLRPQGIVISADIFGMTTVNQDDLGIGQVLEKTIPYFDYVCPMVYPSHFPSGWANLSNPAENPYEVIKKSMGKAVERVVAMGEDPDKLRPWLQDFDLGATYTKELVEDQIDATYELGLDSWLMWDPRNTYTISAYRSPQ